MSMGLSEFLIVVLVGLVLLTVVVVARTAEKQRRARELRAREELDRLSPPDDLR
ncbi:hypothetical protein [Actinokineospora cianjurensis]|uniref:Uncharacterized protein n=1 Tax=Actinokineospora cianjurensis TaxID=585224 RepID=A0A421B956_9PSEU|nr:hypothetical protein [Actinokineospora cianjurensis]RLK60838.1 hypothetical protein CLV68_1352 [Actinokineospora cianjurensis]